jgi:hypothetical protein
MVSMRQNSFELAAGGMRTNRSSPMAGILMGFSVHFECRKDMGVAASLMLG